MKESVASTNSYYVTNSDRSLPPAITNIMCRRLDKRLTQMGQQWDFVYTRYADNLTFSTSAKNHRICNLLKNTDSIVQHTELGGFVATKSQEIEL